MSLKKFVKKSSGERVSGLKLLRQPVLLATKYSSKLSYDELVNAESALGKMLFGPIPAGRQREFFEHKKNVWIWHESWLDADENKQETTIRYEVRPEGVYKKPMGGVYEKLAGQELDNFVTAVRSYYELVKTRLYTE